MVREIFVVIPAHDRQGMLADLLIQLNMPKENIILIDNNSKRPLSLDFKLMATVEPYANRNIQAMWNYGWEEASFLAKDRLYAVAFLNSDVMTTKYDLKWLASALDENNASVSYVDHCGIVGAGRVHMNTVPGPVEWCYRMSGYCFVARGELDTHFDEDLVWWYGDDDFEWRARNEFGGTVMVGGVQAENRDPNGAQRDYPELAEQIDKDRLKFIDKWGVASQDWTVYNKEVYDARFGKRE